MKQCFTHLLALAVLLSSVGCAGSYTPIRPDRLASYQASAATPVQLAYQFDVLRQTGRNKKYVKKESKKGYRVVAVRVTNNTAREINFSRDLTLYFGDRPVTPVPSTVAAQDMKQGVAIYLLYLLLNVQVGGTTTTNQFGQTTTQGGTFLPTGPFIAGGNMLGAGLANANFRNDLTSHDLTDRNIKPGESVYGIISLRETGLAPLRVELRPEVAAGASSPAAPAAAPPPIAAPPATPPATSPVRND